MARVALRYWEDPQFVVGVENLIPVLTQGLNDIREAFPDTVLALRGRGLMRGIVFADAETAATVSSTAYEKASIIAETCGSRSEVLKLLPPVVIGQQDLQTALHGLRAAVAHTENQRSKTSQ